MNGALEDYTVLERALSRHEPDTVFHLGAQTVVGAAYRSPLSTFEANIRGTYNLLEACRIHQGVVHRVVVASSDKAYGEHQGLPYTEDMSLSGRYPYEVSKSCADLLAQAYFHTYGVPVAIARCGNVYGGGDLNWSRIVPGTIRAFLRGTRPIIRSDGAYVRDYIYVKDVISAYIRLAEWIEGQLPEDVAFNVSNESPITVLELVGTIQELMGAQALAPDVRNTAKGEIRNQYLSSQKAQKVLGWTAEYSLKAGLVEAIAWYRGFFQSPADSGSNR